MNKSVRHRRGVSQVISSLILSVVVLVIGLSVWSVASSASSIMQSDYYDEVGESIEIIKERFYIENIGYNETATPKVLKVWIVNYGKTNIVIEYIRVKGSGNISTHLVNLPIDRGEMVRVDLTPTDVYLNNGISIALEVKSTKGNKAYDSILLP